MKLSILTLISVLFSTITFGSTFLENNSHLIIESNNKVACLNILDDIYPAVATTQNRRGKNYSINIQIHGRKNKQINVNYLTKVTVNGKTVRHTQNRRTRAYSFTYENETYYFNW